MFIVRAVVILLISFGLEVNASELCISNNHLTTNPHDYKKCAGVHRPNPATIKHLPGLEQKYKHYLKLETLTPGTALNHLVTSTSGALAINQASSFELAKKGAFKAYHSAIADEVEGIVNGGVAEAGELGLSAEAAETLGGIAVASGAEYVLPIVAVAALASATGVAFTATMDSLQSGRGSSTPTTQDALRRYVKEQMENRAKVKRISKYRMEVTVGVPVKCRFPRILQSKVYVNQSTKTITDFVAANPDLQRVRSMVTGEVFNRIYQNMKPQHDNNEQFCDYLRLEDKQFPFNFIQDITQATSNEHDVYSVTRKFILNTEAGGSVLTVVPENDVLHSGRSKVTFDQRRYDVPNLGSLKIPTPRSMAYYREPQKQLFAYSGGFGSVLINTFTKVGRSSIITLGSEMEFYQYQNPNQKMLNPRKPRRFTRRSWTGASVYWRDTNRAAGLQKRYVDLFDVRGNDQGLTIGSIISGLRTPVIDQIVAKLLNVKSIWFSDGSETFVAGPRPPLSTTGHLTADHFLFYRRHDEQRDGDQHGQIYLNRDALLGIAAVIELTGLEDKDPAVWEWLITKSTRIYGADFMAYYGVPAFNSIHPDLVNIQRTGLGSVAPHATSSRNIGVMDFSTLFNTMATWQRDYDTAVASRYPSPCRINVSSVYLKSLINKVNFNGDLRVDLSNLVRHYLGGNAVLDAACWLSLERRLDHVNYDYYLRGVSKNVAVSPLIPSAGPATEKKLSVKLSGSENLSYLLGTIARQPNNNSLIDIKQENATYLMRIASDDKLIFKSSSNSLADVEELLNKLGGLTLDLIKIKKNNPDGAPAL